MLLFQYPVAFKGIKAVDETALGKFKANLDLLKDFLKPTGFAAGTKEASLADLSLLAAYTTFRASGSFFVDFAQYPELNEWAEKVSKVVPNYEHNNTRGQKIFEEFFAKRLENAK